MKELLILVSKIEGKIDEAKQNQKKYPLFKRDVLPRDSQSREYLGGDPKALLSMVQGMSFLTKHNHSKLIIDLDRDTKFTHRFLEEDSTIKKPQRIYIDLIKSRLGKDVPRFLFINDEILEEARMGRYTADSVRIVVDIKSFKNYKILSFNDPFRIVLDVMKD